MRYARHAVLVLALMSSALVAWLLVHSMRGAHSLCPKEADSAGFLALLDPIPPRVTGSDLDVYYDVCGLASGSTYSGRLRLSRQEERLKKLLGGGSKPRTTTFQERATGPAIRDRRRIGLQSLRPGAYALELIVTDNRGRERRRTQTVLVTDH